MEKILPIGSIIYLKGGEQKLMILNRGPQADVDGVLTMFDYSASPYPAGMSPEHVIFFNAENIDKVLFEGYIDEAEERFLEVYKEWLEVNKDIIVRGEVKAITAEK